MKNKEQFSITRVQSYVVIKWQVGLLYVYYLSLPRRSGEERKCISSQIFNEEIETLDLAPVQLCNVPDLYL